MIIPECQRDILEKIHQAHHGVAKCQLRAKSCVFWPNVNKDIKAKVQKCEISQESQNTQTKETLEPHKVPIHMEWGGISAFSHHQENT